MRNGGLEMLEGGGGGVLREGVSKQLAAGELVGEGPG